MFKPHRRRADRRRNRSSMLEHIGTICIVLLVCAVWVLFLSDLVRRFAP